MSAASMNAKKASEAPLNHNQIRGFWAAWGGWALDGMDSFIYALVLVPSLVIARLAAAFRNSRD